MATYGQVAKSVAADKAAHPERYCRQRGCLWKTATPNPKGDGYVLDFDPCQKHAALNEAQKRLDAIDWSGVSR